MVPTSSGGDNGASSCRRCASRSDSSAPSTAPGRAGGARTRHPAFGQRLVSRDEREERRDSTPRRRGPYHRAKHRRGRDRYPKRREACVHRVSPRRDPAARSVASAAIDGNCSHPPRCTSDSAGSTLFEGGHISGTDTRCAILESPVRLTRSIRLVGARLASTARTRTPDRARQHMARRQAAARRASGRESWRRQNTCCAR